MSVRDFIPNDGSLWSIRANDISGNYDQAIDLDPSSNFAFSRNGVTIATLGSNLITPSTASLYNSLNVNGTYFSNNVSAIRIPADTSDNRPAGVAGYIRYNTNTNIIEYWNASTSMWLAVSEPPPTITSISPLSVPDNSGGTIDVSVNIVGDNFGTSPLVYFIGSDSVQRLASSVTNIITGTQVRAVLPSSVFDASNQEPFAVKLTNTSSSLSVTTVPPNVIDINTAPYFITQSPLPDISNNSFVNPFTLSGQLDISAGDIDDNTLTFTSPSPNPISDIQSGALTINSSSGAVTGTLSNPGANTSYNFNVQITDTANNFRVKLYSFNFIVPPTSLTYSSGASLPSPLYVNSGGVLVGGPVVGGFTIYSFVVTTNQYTSTTYSFSINKSTSSIHFLCVGGGGGAAAYNSCGGGGAGGFRTSFSTNTGFSGGGGALESSISLTNGTTYTVTVGGGSQGSAGNGGSFSGSPNTVSQGLASSISGSGLTTIISYGGSPGACNQAGATKPQDYVNQPATGSQPSAGSGGGARGDPAAPGGTNVGGTGTAGQGYNGGSNALYSGNYPGGGGGGAGSVGQSLSADTFAGAGGSGIQTAITGTAQFYAGGGGGSTQASGASDVGGGGSAPAGAGGSSVGGNGRGSPASPLSGFSGAANTGSGGGAGCNANITPDAKGGDGSAGIVVIRFPSL